MTFSDNASLAKLREYADRARRLFSNPQKPERERMIVRAFLRCAGEAFEDGEIIASSEEPIDVRFRSADFQWRSLATRDADWSGVCVRTDIAMHNVSQMYWSRTSHRSRCRSTMRQSSSPIVCRRKPRVMAPPRARAWTPWSTSIFTIGTCGRLCPPIMRGPLPCFKPRAGDLSPCSLCPTAVVLLAAPTAPAVFGARAGRVLNEWPGLDGLFDP